MDSEGQCPKLVTYLNNVPIIMRTATFNAKNNNKARATVIRRSAVEPQGARVIHTSRYSRLAALVSDLDCPRSQNNAANSSVKWRVSVIIDGSVCTSEPISIGILLVGSR